MVIEYRWRKPSGELVWIEDRARIERDAEDNPLLLRGTLADITPRERLLERERAIRAEAEALAESRALYEAAAINLSDGLALVDADDRVVFWNRSLERLFGLSAEDAVGKAFADLARLLAARSADPEDTACRGRAARAKALAGTPSAFAFTLESTPRRHLISLIFPISGPNGPLGLGRLVRDVTAERDAERIKDEFVALVSHELRTPLTSIKGYLSLVLDGDAGEVPLDQREFLEVAARNTERLEALVNDLLDLSRIEAGRLELKRERLDFAALTSQTAESLRPQLESKGQTITVEVDDDLPEIWGDARRISQVIGNLVSNAHKYSAEGGGIAVRAVSEGDQIRIDVRDTGDGLTADERARLFTKFYRADNRATQAVSGTGLGLVIVRSLVEAHGGTISVESEIGVGSTFTVRLPIRTSERAAQPPSVPRKVTE